MRLSCVLLLGFLLIAMTVRATEPSPSLTTAAPPTRVEPVTETLHGVAVTDPYRWLEGDNSNPDRMGAVTPEVAAWTDAQNAFTRATLDNLPGRAALEARLKPLMQIGTVSIPEVRADRFFFSKREGMQNQPVWYWRQGARGADRLLLDPARLDPSGLTTITWISPSTDGKLVAYGTYRSGDENSTLHLIEVEGGRKLPTVISNKVQAPDWLPDGSGFVYWHLADAQNAYSGQVRYHELGTDPAADPVLLRQYTKAENEKLATTWGPGGSLSRDGRWLLLDYATSTRSNDLWVSDFAAFRKTGKLERREVSVGKEGQITGVTVGDRLYLHTNQGAPNGKIEVIDLATWSRRDLVPERRDEVIQNFSTGRGTIVVEYLKNASSRFELFSLDGAPKGELRLPGLGSGSLSTEDERTDGYLNFTSFNYPPTIFRVDLERPGAEPEVWERPDVPVDPSTVEVEQVFYPSKDGTRVSMFVVHKKGLPRDGMRPTILTGYGGFNISETPAFKATLFPWFEDGGVYALPNLRGGGEYGDAWHEAGMLEHKQNTFDDFVAAAEWLIANRYTSTPKLAIVGGSNGGLLTGAAIAQRPDLFGAAIVAVPLLDMLRYQNFLMARYWVPEYGTAEDAKHFPFLAAYSPYQQVKEGVRYPAVYLTAGENDTRVHALHARKMAARLQAIAAKVENPEPVLLWVEREAGHGQGKPLNLKIRDAADERIFLMWQLGMLPQS
jgi:prolyl oligopeptidase